MQDKHKYQLIAILCLASMPLLSLATTNTNLSTADNTMLPMVPRSSITGTAASGAWIGGADSLIPIYGSRTDGLLYTDIGGEYDNHDAFSISPGAGLRLVTHNNILGTYVFGDYSQTYGNGNFFAINPGIEWMNTRWDTHINGYFPTSHEDKIKNLGFASYRGNQNYLSFSGHSEYDQQLIQYGVVGNGVDAEEGYSFSWNQLRARVYVGGYHYAPPQVSNITGGQAGVECPINRYASVVLASSYDNVFKTNASMTLRFTFGNPTDNISNDVSDRLVDPIPRHLGTLDTASAIPSQKFVTNSGTNQAILNHIWFFQPGSSTASGVTTAQCTFEHPCVGLNQQVVDSIGQQDQGALFYFAPGTYEPVGSPSPSAGLLTLNSGQSFWGRTYDYKNPASGNNRAVIDGALALPGNNTVDSMQILNNDFEVNTSLYGNNIVGINVLGTSPGAVTLNNLAIGATNATDTLSNGAFSVYAENNTPITINNSTLNATENIPTSANGAENLVIVGNNTVNLNRSTLTATDASSGGAYGAFMAHGLSTLNVNNSVFNISSSGDSISTGIYVQTAGIHVNVNNSVINSAETNLNAFAGAMDIVSIDNSDITIDNSVLNATNSSVGGAFAVKMIDGNITINNSILNTADYYQNAGGGSGDFVQYDGSALINNSVLNAIEYGQLNGGAFSAQLYGGAATIANSTLNANDNGSNGAAAVFINGGQGTMSNDMLNVLENDGGQAVGVFVQSGSANIDGGDFNIVGAGPGIVGGIEALNASTITMTHSLLNLTSTSGNIVGATANGSANITMNDDDFALISSLSGQASGVQNNGTGSISAVNTDFAIFGNGSSVFNSGAGTVNRSGGTCFVNGVPCPP